LDISAVIKRIEYKFLLCRELKEYRFSNLKDALDRESSFILKVRDKVEFGASKWVSPKRTRSYPYIKKIPTSLFCGISVVK